VLVALGAMLLLLRGMSLLFRRRRCT